MFVFMTLAFGFVPNDTDSLSTGTFDKSPIINGTSSSIEDYPETGAILMTADIDWGGSSQPFSTLVCSSTLIAPDVVLTAGHCVDETSFTFGIGEIDNIDMRWTRSPDLREWDGMSASPAWPADAIKVWDYVAHPDYSLEGIQTGVSQGDDIALIFLEEAILDFEHAYLPTSSQGADLQEGDIVEIVGWGQQIATSPWEYPPADSYALKQHGTSEIVELGDYEFKVGELESDVRKCHGDSGGPSFKRIDDYFRVVGVTSHAYDQTDCFETGGVDTRVDPYLDWIEQEMIDRCEDGTRVWCEIEGIVYPGDIDSDSGTEPDPESNDNSTSDGDIEEEKPKSCATMGLKDLSWMIIVLAFTLVGWRRSM